MAEDVGNQSRLGDVEELMTTRQKHLLCVAGALCILAVACSSEPESVIAGDDGDVSDVAELADDASSDIALIGLDSPSDLLGSAWTVETVDGEPYEGEGALSFYGESEWISVTWIDDCSTGNATFVARDGAFLLLSGGGRNNVCIGHPTSVLEAYEEAVRFTIDVNGPSLTLSSEAHSLTATHFQSQSIHDQPMPLPGLDYPDLDRPDVQDYSMIREATNIPFAECPTEGRIGLEDDPFEEQHLAASKRLSQITGGLPFVVWSSSAGGNLRHHEAGLGLGVRYQPTIDWLAANFAPTDLCLDLPPIGYYDTPPTLLPWRLADEFEVRSDYTSILVVHDLDCEVGDWSRLLDPQVQYLDDEIRIGLPQLPSTFGQSSDGMCEFPHPLEVELDEPVAGRAIVPATTMIQ